MDEKRESSKLHLNLSIIKYSYHFLGRMTMLDERYLSLADLAERQQELSSKIKSLE